MFGGSLPLERLAEWHGMEVRRSRHRDRVWLVLDGRLFSPRSGHDEATARALLGPARSSTPAP